MDGYQSWLILFVCSSAAGHGAVAGGQSHTARLALGGHVCDRQDGAVSLPGANGDRRAAGAESALPTADRALRHRWPLLSRSVWLLVPCV